MNWCITACGCAALLLCGWREYPRDPQVTRDFQATHPCPSTGLRYGACPGYIKDHINPLCAGGPDAVSNMQWQTKEDSYRKDEWELALCRSLRHQERINAPAGRTQYHPTWNPRTDR